MSRTPVICTLIASCALLGTAAILTAGPLDPPAGPVTPSYKTLTEVEPRTAVNATNTPGDSTAVYVISQPGSYYLSGTVVTPAIKVGVRITASNVELDLNGFAIEGATSSTAGVQLSSGVAQVKVRNGRISTIGSHGISAAASNVCVFEDLTADACGGNGFDLGDFVTVTRCEARANSGIGIRVGGSSTVTRCKSAINGTGIELNSSSMASDCIIVSNSVKGIAMNGIRASAEHNSVVVGGVNATGILCAAGSQVVRDNTITGNGLSGQKGLSVTAPSCTIGGNLVRDIADCYSITSTPQLQVELIISQLPESLDVPCTARLVGSMTSTGGTAALLVNSDGVTVDLNGSELVGSGSSGVGIRSAAGKKDIVVRNGTIRGFSSGGIDLSNSMGTRVERITASGNTGPGIVVTGSSVVNCISTGNTGAGIVGGDNSIIDGCMSNGNTSDNILVYQSCRVSNCVANQSISGNGINCAVLYNTVVGCTANSNSLNGIVTGQRGRVSECTVTSNGSNGVKAAFAGTIERCNIGSNAACGILMDSGGGFMIRDNHIHEHGTTNTAAIRIVNAGFCTVTGNRITSAYRGLDIQAGSNFIAGNTVCLVGAGGSYTIVPGNSYGPILNVANVGDINTVANSGHSQANFYY